MQQDKNFDVRLKASIDKRIEEAGIWNMVLDACKDYDEYKAKKQAFMDSLNDITLNKLQGIKAATPSPAQPPGNGEGQSLAKTIDEEARKFALWNYVHAGVYNVDVDVIDTWPYEAQVCYHTLKNYLLGDPVCMPDHKFLFAATPPASPAKAEQEGPWKYEVHHVPYREDAEEYATISDGKVTLFIDGGEDEGDEQRVVDLLNRLKITLDYDREAEHVAFQLEEQNKELYAEIQKREQEGLKWVRYFKKKPDIEPIRTIIFKWIGKTNEWVVGAWKSDKIEQIIKDHPGPDYLYLDESAPKEAGQVDPVAFAAAMQAEIDSIEWGLYGKQVWIQGANWAKQYLESLNKQQ